MNKTIFTLVLGLGLSLSGQATITQPEIKKLMDDSASGQAIDIQKMSGNYKGTCYITLKQEDESSQFTTNEALYVGNFVNAKNQKVDLAVTSEIAHADIEVHQSLSFVTKANNQGAALIKAMIQKGQIGNDNNLGLIHAGIDYFYNYISDSSNGALKVTTEKFDSNCTDPRALCSPAVLEGCESGYSSKGEVIYKGCVRSNDKTTFKQISESTIISTRIADGLGSPTNSLSFSLPDYTSYCVFEK